MSVEVGRISFRHKQKLTPKHLLNSAMRTKANNAQSRSFSRLVYFCFSVSSFHIDEYVESVAILIDCSSALSLHEHFSPTDCYALESELDIRSGQANSGVLRIMVLTTSPPKVCCEALFAQDMMLDSVEPTKPCVYRNLFLQDQIKRDVWKKSFFHRD